MTKEKVSFVVYKVVDRKILYFVGKRPGQDIFLHPTAKLEEGENYIEAGFREIKEELGDVIILNFTDLKRDFTFSNEFGEFRESVVAFEIKDVVKIQEEEFSSYDFLSKEEALGKLTYANHRNNIKGVEKLLSESRETKFFIFVAPTASGKSVVIKSLLGSFPNEFERVKTYMTREFKRAEDPLLRIHVNKEEFDELDKRGMLIEKNFHDGNWYGSSFKLIEKSLRTGKNLIAEVDINGLRVLNTHFHNIISIFISSPLDEMELRLRERGGHSEQEIAKRLEIAKMEISQKDYSTYVVENRQGRLDDAIHEILEVVSREICKELI